MELRQRVIEFRRFETTYIPYLKWQKFPLDMEDEDSSVPRISGTDYSVTRRHIPEEQYLQLHRCENLQTHTFSLIQKVNCPSIACCRNVISFLGASARLWKATIASSCLSVSPPLCIEQLGSYWTDFREIRYLWIFRKSIEKTQVSLKSDNYNGQFTRRPIYNFIISRSFLLRMRNISHKSCTEYQTHILCSVTFFS
jgi:hypothetical protein